MKATHEYRALHKIYEITEHADPNLSAAITKIVGLTVPEIEERIEELIMSRETEHASFTIPNYDENSLLDELSSLIIKTKTDYAKQFLEISSFDEVNKSMPEWILEEYPQTIKLIKELERK